VRGDTDAYRDVEVMVSDDDRFLSDPRKLLGERDDTELGGWMSHEDGEFIASKTSECICRFSRSTEAAGETLKETIADFVAERVIDQLEIVDTGDQQCRRNAWSGQRSTDAVGQQRSVGEICQRVMQRLTAQSLLRNFPLGNQRGEMNST
jgi:hypothetical protein